MYEAIVRQSTACRNAVMQAVKKLLPRQVNARVWPSTNRTLRAMVRRNAGSFWDNVVETHVVDLRQFNLPGCASVEFSFVDPVFVWIQRCNELHKRDVDLKWEPVALHHPETGEAVYGAGVECGLLLRAATESVPENGKVALMNLSWDGGNTSFVGRSATPILLQVMNSNTLSPACVGLLGYLPCIEVSKKHKGYDKAKRHVLQVRAT